MRLPTTVECQKMRRRGRIRPRLLNRWPSVIEQHLSGRARATALRDHTRLLELRAAKQLDSDEAIGRFYRMTHAVLDGICGQRRAA